MAEYIEKQKAINACFDGWNNTPKDCVSNIRNSRKSSGSKKNEDEE